MSLNLLSSALLDADISVIEDLLDNSDELHKSIIINVLMEISTLQKGERRKRAVIGEIRSWNNGQYVKHIDGWVRIGGKHHGKLAGNFKGHATHTEIADKHTNNNNNNQGKPKPQESIKEKTETREEPKTESTKEETVETKKESKFNKQVIIDTFTNATPDKSEYSVFERAAKVFEEIDMDPRLMTERSITKIHSDKRELNDVGALGTYNVSLDSINISSKNELTVFLHEMGHHVEQKWSKGSIEDFDSDILADRKQRKEDRNAMLQEYMDTLESVKEKSGNPSFDYYRDYRKLVGHKLNKDLISLYSLHTTKEWFAESFMAYCDPAKRKKLKRIAPKTYNHIEKLVKGEYFK